MIKLRRALLSVHDKTGLTDLGRALAAAGVELISTGGTARALEDAGLAVTKVSAVTGHPEVFGGRVKTLHPRIHGGILFRRDEPEDRRQAEEHGIGAIDLVVVSLYPFEETVARDGVTRGEAVEEIDIGGPAMIRAAAKNHAHVAVVVDHEDHALVLSELAEHGGIRVETSARLAAKAFARTASYDAAIAGWLGRESDSEPPAVAGLTATRHLALRYGENPHQAATAYVVPGERGGVLQARQIQGKELSYNNIADLDAAWNLVRDLRGPASVIIKHANPCGAAEASGTLEALLAARACDPVSAFGGVYAFSGPVDEETAAAMLDGFVECVIAPEFTEAALAALARKKNVRVLAGELPPRPRQGAEWKRVTGGVLVQDWDDAVLENEDLRIVTQRSPSEAELSALLFCWRIVRHVKSNAIVLGAGSRTLGIGAGQMSRVDSVELAVRKAGKSGLSLEGCVMASDAFFPFRDGVDAAREAGATAVIQPGGSLRDEEVIAACDEHDLAMVITGRRHFRH